VIVMLGHHNTIPIEPARSHGRQRPARSDGAGSMPTNTFDRRIPQTRASERSSGVTACLHRGLPLFLVGIAAVGCGSNVTSGQEPYGGESAGGAPAVSNDANGFAATEDPDGTISELSIRDVDSGAVYDAVGRPVAGDARSPLTPLVGYNQFWFAWSVFNHDSEIFGTAERVSTAPLEPDAECAVPCNEIVLGCPGTDCIPALTRPRQVPPDSPEASYLADNSYVVGVDVGGDGRAYPHNIFWWHEIVNDVVGGVPIALTHCPLTFSSIGHDPTKFASGQTVELGVSGRLFNNNLTFYDRTDGSWFVQLLGVGTQGDALGLPAPRVHVWEMTWAAWRALHPESTVLSDDTGHARSYGQYPYGTYFVDQQDFRATNPPDDPRFPKKETTYGVRFDDAAKAYPYSALAAWANETYGEDSAPAGVVNDSVGSHPVVVVFDLDARYVQAFDGTGLGNMEVAR